MIIKLNHIDNLTDAPGQIDNRTDYINVYRLTYSDDLIAYFMRSRNGTALMINDTLTSDDQARAISMVKKNIKKCGVTNMGLIRGNWQYVCGGPCCANEKNRKI